MGGVWGKTTPDVNRDFVNWRAGIHAPIQAAARYRSGVSINVPQPARCAIHKLIVATRCHASAASKARKDIEQAAALIRVLAEDRPDDLQTALSEAQGADRHGVRRWRKVADGCPTMRDARATVKEAA